MEAIWQIPVSNETEPDQTRMSGPEYSATLPEFCVNLLVRDVSASLAWYEHMLEAKVVQTDAGFAALVIGNTPLMLHADHTYHAHPNADTLASQVRRGVGIELRLQGFDADALKARADEVDHPVLHGPRNTAHGLREILISDPDGYEWTVGSLIAKEGAAN